MGLTNEQKIFNIHYEIDSVIDYYKEIIEENNKIFTSLMSMTEKRSETLECQYKEFINSEEFKKVVDDTRYALNY